MDSQFAMFFNMWNASNTGRFLPESWFWVHTTYWTDKDFGADIEIADLRLRKSHASYVL